MRSNKLFGIVLYAAFAVQALASDWDVNVIVSQGQLFEGGGSKGGPSIINGFRQESESSMRNFNRLPYINPGANTVDVPFTINATPYASAPATQTVNTLPYIIFLTNGSTPPITVGGSTTYRNATFTSTYTIQSNKEPLTGFYFVVSGHVWELGQIKWTKKVVDRDTNVVLFDRTWVFSGAGYPGGGNGSFLFSGFFPLSQPSSNLLVIENFRLRIDGASAPGTSTASLLLVEQSWVPEPASLLVLGVGLGGLLLRRRRAK